MTDQLVNDSFDKVYRRGRLEVNNRLKAAQERLKTSQSVSANIVMHLIKASPQVGDKTSTWVSAVGGMCGEGIGEKVRLFVQAVEEVVPIQPTHCSFLYRPQLQNFFFGYRIHLFLFFGYRIDLFLSFG